MSEFDRIIGYETIKDELRRFFALSLTERDKEKILYENARTFLSVN